MATFTPKSLLLTGALALSALASESPGQGPAPVARKDESVKRGLREGFIAYYGYCDVVVATVTAVSDHGATNGRPPRVTLRVEKVLRGSKGLDRSSSVWKPYIGPLCGNDRSALQWFATPLPGPKVGTRWILWGDLPPRARIPARFRGRARAERHFEVRADPRMPYSEANLKKTRELIEKAAQGIRKYKADRAAEKNRFREAKACWRATVSEKELARFTSQADFVGVGRLISGQTLFHITTILKGKAPRPLPDGSCYAHVAYPIKIAKFLDRKTTYLFFLTEKGSQTNTTGPYYDAVPSSDGLVIADDAALRAVRRALAEAGKR